MAARILDALTRRRLGGAVLVLAGVAVAVVVLAPWDWGDDSPRAKGTPPRWSRFRGSAWASRTRRPGGARSTAA